MKRLLTIFVSMLVACCSQSAMAGGWGPVFAIELRGDGLEQPFELTEPSILEKLSPWVGPGTKMADFMRPDGSEKSIANWDAGVVTDHPAGLQRIEVKFRVGWSRESTDAFWVLYEKGAGSSTGYIYHPIANYIVAHVSEGAWRYASDRWNEIIGPIIEKHTIAGAKGEFSCQVQARGRAAAGKAAGRSCWPTRRESPI
ncbi:MAG: hypothetical protein OXI90_13410 [Gammaproteobacteria bacterium]|nr:hypothetical protein [Gammaproteobacteria bacterium]